MRKVLIFYPYISTYGGIEETIILLAKNIRKKKLQPVILCFSNQLKIQKYFKYLKVIELGDGNYLKKIINLKIFLKDYEKNYKGHALFYSYKSAFFAALINFKNYILHLDDTLSLLKKEEPLNKINFFSDLRKVIVHQINKKGIENAVVRLTTTNKNAQEFLKDYNQKFEVAYHGVSLKNIYQNKKKRNTLNLVSISRLEKPKNLEWAIYSFEKLLRVKKFLKYFKKINLFIIGDGSDKKRLIDFANKIKINNNVFFAGFVSYKKKLEILSQANFFLVPAVQGYGLPVLEGLVRGIPVVINKETRVSEILKNNPWVRISKNNKKDFSKNVISHVKNLYLKLPNKKFLTNLPSQLTWSNLIFKICKW